jgi:hypothetical protein
MATKKYTNYKEASDKTIRRAGNLYDTRYFNGRKETVRVIKLVGINDSGGAVYLCKIMKGERCSCGMHSECTYNDDCLPYGGHRACSCYWTGYLYPLDKLERTINNY